jgi:hypothetical protein
MGQNSALKARIKHAKKNTPIGNMLKKFTRDLKTKGKGQKKVA